MMKTRTCSLAVAIAALVLPAGAEAQRGARTNDAPAARSDTTADYELTPSALEFLREPQKRLRIDTGNRLLELSNARHVGAEIRFDYAWDPAEPSRIRKDLDRVLLADVHALYRRRTDRLKGALMGGLGGLALGAASSALEDTRGEEAVLTVLVWAGMGALLGSLFGKSIRWERVFP